MIQVKNLSKQFGGRTLFQNVSFNINKGERVGLVGRNGSGKTTLFNVILGRLSPDKGEVAFPKGYKVGHLDQHIHFERETVLDECVQALPDERKFDFYLAEKILNGLGFDDSDMQKPPSGFSGGYQIRINLCKALLGEPDLLLLDEPTNYLDIVSMRWLASFLRSFKGEIILITHDRDFMDRVSTHTMGIHRKGLKKIQGGTEKFYEQMLLEEEIHEKTRLNQEKKRDHLESFVERFRAKATKAAQAQSRVKQLEKMDRIEKLDQEGEMGLVFRHKECHGKELLRADNLSFGYDPSALLVKCLDMTIGPCDRIGIIGKNGKGKSTLLNLLAGELEPLEGSIASHPSAAKGHFGQTNVARLSTESTVEDEIQGANPALSKTAVRNICGSMMFEGENALKKVKVLSGGEKNRVLLGKIVASPCNLLLLDEPTNHLDMESIEILADEIERFPGAVVLVTHSEALLRRIAQKLVVFTSQGANVFDGDYDNFLQKIGWEDEATVNETGQSDKNPNKPKKYKKSELHAKRQEIIRRRSKTCKPLQSELDALEAEIIRLEARLELQQKELETGTKQSDNQKILESSRKIGEIEERISNQFERMGQLETEISERMAMFEEELEALEKE